MDMLADRTGDPSQDLGPVHPERPTETPDVPGLSAGHIGDLYAAEERQRRTQRTELMIARALEQR